jgi:septal ring factor EnvC (AmiA/AmiB activator)
MEPEMTNDEFERAIEHILNNQANFEVQFEKTNQQITRTNEQLVRTDEQITRTDAQLARTDAQLARTDAQLARTDAQLARTDERLAQTIKQVDRTGRQVEEMSMRLDAYAETQTQFIQIVTRHIEAQGEINASLRASLAHTDKRLDVLIDIVREGRNGQA